VRPRSDGDRRQENETELPVVRDVAPLRVMHVHGMTSEQGFKMLPLLLALLQRREATVAITWPESARWPRACAADNKHFAPIWLSFMNLRRNEAQQYSQQRG
jgi:hypothetical protein